MPFFGSDWRDEESLSGSIFGPRQGTWWVSSKTDPRWNKTGRGYGLVCTGGPGEMGEWIEKCKQEFGEPPADCESGFMKD